MPPLRKRRGDIPLLIHYFIDRYAKQAGKKITHVSKKSLDLLQQYPWPGNVRELQNIVERSVILCETEEFSVDEKWLSLTRVPVEEPRSQPDLSNKLASHEKEMIESALRECQGRVFGPNGAAVKLGIPRSTLESRIRSLKINKHRFKG
jgi:DNA-binding NtrC family response regulator